MHHTIKIMTLNINGVSNTRMRMLDEFTHKQDVDIAPLQEVTHDNFDTVRGYNAILNIGMEKRGTAILAKWEHTLREIKRLPSGRSIAATLLDVWIINVYAPSGAEKRHDREIFFNQGITYLFPTSSTRLIMAGDFNCVTSSVDCSGAPNMSRALKSLLAGMGLADAWDTHHIRPAYTHFTSGGAARIDRIYITDELRSRKQGSKDIPAVFTDHLAVALRITFGTPATVPRRFTWRMNITLLRQQSFKQQLNDHWANRRRAARQFPTKVQWWESRVKRRLRQVFQREGTARQRDRRELENLYYEMMHQVLQNPIPNENTGMILRKLKAIIIRLNTIQQRGVKLDVHEADTVPGEEISVHQYIRSRNQRTMRTISQVTDEQGEQWSEQTQILRIFTTHMSRLFDTIAIDETSFRQLVAVGTSALPDTAADLLEEPITLEELETAIRNGKKKKIPWPRCYMS
jgi:exonuclease III